MARHCKSGATTATPDTITVEYQSVLVDDLGDHAHVWAEGIPIADGLYRHLCLCYASMYSARRAIYCGERIYTSDQTHVIPRETLRATRGLRRTSVLHFP